MPELNTAHGKDPYGGSRVLYIIDATLEYFVAIITAGAYLAKLTSTLGISDSLTGILTSFVSLGGFFSLFSALVMKKKPVRNKVAIIQIICQLAFVVLFLTPCFDIANNIAVLIFCAAFLVGYALYYLLYTIKADWYMGLVPTETRGNFTAIINVVSLSTGMMFSFVMSLIIEYYDGIGSARGFLIASAIIMGVIGLLRVLTVFFSKEKPSEDASGEDASLLEMSKSLFRNKRFVALLIFFSLYFVARYISHPFYGTYQINELGFSMIYVSVITVVQMLARILGTIVFGKLGDKASFNTVLNLTCIMFAASLAVITFTTPANGHVMFMIYTVLDAIMLGGMSICQVNSIFEVVGQNERSAAISLKYSLTGLIGFLATLAVSPLVSLIQDVGFTLFGMTVYAQQIVSALALVIAIGSIIYMNFAILAPKARAVKSAAEGSEPEIKD